MKRTIFIGACLAIFNLTALTANNSDSLFISDKDTETKSSEVKPEAKLEMETISLIPDKVLKLKISEDQKFLVIDLKGDVNEKMDWIIFEKGGETVGRINTEKNIDEIKICNLPKGDYVLMIKDESGRLLHQPFHKS